MGVRFPVHKTAGYSVGCRLDQAAGFAQQLGCFAPYTSKWLLFRG
jgi:hypothetical protein